jgi:hypothetical protein
MINMCIIMIGEGVKNKYAIANYDKGSHAKEFRQ